MYLLQWQQIHTDTDTDTHTHTHKQLPQPLCVCRGLINFYNYYTDNFGKKHKIALSLSFPNNNNGVDDNQSCRSNNNVAFAMTRASSKNIGKHVPNIFVSYHCKNKLITLTAKARPIIA